MHAFIYMYVACSEGTCLLLMDDSAILRSCIRVGSICYVALHNARTVRAVMYVSCTCTCVCVCLCPELPSAAVKVSVQTIGNTLFRYG